MFVLRYIVLPLTLIFTVLALVGTVPLPIYNLKINYLNQVANVEVTLWWMKTGKSTVNDTIDIPAGETVRFNYCRCSALRSTFRAMQAFSIAGVVFGFYSFLLSCLQCCCKLKVKLPLFLFLVFAFVSEFFLVCIGGAAFTKSYCKSDKNIGEKLHFDMTTGLSVNPSSTNDSSENVSVFTNFTSANDIRFKKSGYKLGIAYTIQIVACAGYLICMILAPFTQQLWCNSC